MATQPRSRIDHAGLEGWREGKSDYQISKALMQRMGARSYDPMPPAQHAWQRGSDSPEVHRVWSWMCAHTIHWGHRNEYAIDTQGHELHIEHIAHDLEMDQANVRRAWREGVERGLWRHGTKEEGRSRLYLCGEVKAVLKSGEEKEQEVCADLLPPYILRQINTLPPERQKEFWEYHARDLALDNQLRADLDAARRLIIAQRQDTRFREFGIKKIENKEHRPKHVDPETLAERQARIQALLPVLEPVAERYAAPTLVELSAQTGSDSAQSEEISVRTKSAQAVSDRSSFIQAQLPEKPHKERASGHSGAPGPLSASLPDEGKKRNGYLPVLRELPKLTGEEEDAENLLWNEIRNMQQAYPHTDFSSELIDRKRRSDQLFIRRVLEAVGADNVTQFVLHVAAKFRGHDSNGLAKLPPRSPEHPTGPRSLGLILTWAVAYGSKLDESARDHMRISKSRRDQEVAACLAILQAAPDDPTVDAITREGARELLRAHGIEHGAPPSAP